MSSAQAKARAELARRQRERGQAILDRLAAARAAAEPPAILTRAELEQLVDEAEAAGLEFVELVVPRKAPPTRASGFTVKLLGLRGPRSSPDKPPMRVGPRAWAAHWLVSDLRSFLRSPGRIQGWD